MLKLLADENFNNDILRGLRRSIPTVDSVRVQDVLEISGKDDPSVIACDKFVAFA